MPDEFDDPDVLAASQAYLRGKRTVTDEDPIVAAASAKYQASMSGPVVPDTEEGNYARAAEGLNANLRSSREVGNAAGAEVRRINAVPGQVQAAAQKDREDRARYLNEQTQREAEDQAPIAPIPIIGDLQAGTRKLGYDVLSTLARPVEAVSKAIGMGEHTDGLADSLSRSGQAADIARRARVPQIPVVSDVVAGLPPLAVAAATGNPEIAAPALFGATTANEALQQAHDAGMSDSEALAHAVATGGINAAGGELLGTLAKPLAAEAPGLARRLLQSAGIGGATNVGLHNLNEIEQVRSGMKPYERPTVMGNLVKPFAGGALIGGLAAGAHGRGRVEDAAPLPTPLRPLELPLEEIGPTEAARIIAEENPHRLMSDENINHNPFPVEQMPHHVPPLEPVDVTEKSFDEMAPQILRENLSLEGHNDAQPRENIATPEEWKQYQESNKVTPLAAVGNGDGVLLSAEPRPQKTAFTHADVEAMLPQRRGKLPKALLYPSKLTAPEYQTKIDESIQDAPPQPKRYFIKKGDEIYSVSESEARRLLADNADSRQQRSVDVERNDPNTGLPEQILKTHAVHGRGASGEPLGLELPESKSKPVSPLGKPLALPWLARGEKSAPIIDDPVVQRASEAYQKRQNTVSESEQAPRRENALQASPAQGAGQSEGVPPLVPPGSKDAFGIKQAMINEPGDSSGEVRTHEALVERAKTKLLKDPTAGDRLVDALRRKKRPTTDDEAALLVLHRAGLEMGHEDALHAETALRKAGKSTDAAAADVHEFEEKLRDMTRVVGKGGATTAVGQAMAALKIEVNREYTLSKRIMERAHDKGRDLLPDEKAHLTQVHENIANLEKQVQKLESGATEAPPGKAQPTASEKLASFADKWEREGRADLKRSSGFNVGAPIGQIAALAKILAAKIARGISAVIARGEMRREFGNVVDMHWDAIHEQAGGHVTSAKKEASALKNIEKRTADYDQRRADKNFEPKARAKPMQTEALNAARAKLERARDAYEMDRAADRAAKAPLGERIAKKAEKVVRGSVLSSPAVFEKLFGASVLRGVTTPVEQLIGAGLKKVLPLDLTENAPRHGTPSLQAEINAAKSLPQGMRDAKDTLATGKSDLEAELGKKRFEDKSVFDKPGHGHAAAKAPIKRNEFERSLQLRIEHAERHNIDTTKPREYERLRQEAYKDSERGIFQQDNAVVDAYNAALNSLDRRGGGARLLSAIARGVQPVVKVPTNIVAETLEHAFGTEIAGTKLGWRALTKQALKDMTPDQADAVMRQLKKGVLGKALLLMGWSGYKGLGGLFTPGEKRKDGEPEAGGIADIPAHLLHSPAVMTLQMGAEARQVYEQHKDKGEDTSDAANASAQESILGIAREMPFVRTAETIAKIFNPNTRPAAEGQLARGLIVPQIFQFTAKKMDPEEKRYPKGAVENFKVGVPWLRQQVPAMKPKHHK